MLSSHAQKETQSNNVELRQLQPQDHGDDAHQAALVAREAELKAEKRRVKELEAAMRLKDRDCNAKVGAWEVKHSAATRAVVQAEEAARRVILFLDVPFQAHSLTHSSFRRTSTQRYSALLANLRLTEDEACLLLADPLWPPARQRFPDQTLIDLLWLLTDQHDERDESRRVLEEKLARGRADHGGEAACRGDE